MSFRKTPTYESWIRMRQRCSNKKRKQYHNYGGRGIKVCERWQNSFTNFLLDMGERPIGMTLDRIDNNGNYEPLNCRWATKVEQNHNRRDNHLITLDGITRCMKEWSKIKGLNYLTVSSRINIYGWDPVAALELPVNPSMPRDPDALKARRRAP